MGDGEVKFSNLSGFMQGVLILLSILGIVVPATLGFVNVDKRIDIVETGQEKHLESDEKFREDVGDDIDAIEGDVSAIKVSQAEHAAHYAHIQSDLNEIKAILKTLERVD